jgi:hypothetical protein
MDKDFWKSFNRWLTEGTDVELSEKKYRLERFLTTATDDDPRSDAKKMVRAIELEVLSRIMK